MRGTCFRRPSSPRRSASRPAPTSRNAAGTVVGTTFFGRGWGHGVGMCQVDAYGMALAGATYEEILKKYYTGIELQKLY